MGVLLHEDRLGVIAKSIDLAEVAANTTAEQDITVTGLTTDMFVAVNKPSLSAGLGVVNARVKSANTLALTLVNATASPINAAAETYLIFWMKPEAQDTEVVR